MKEEEKKNFLQKILEIGESIPDEELAKLPPELSKWIGNEWEYIETLKKQIETAKREVAKEILDEILLVPDDCNEEKTYHYGFQACLSQIKLNAKRVRKKWLGDENEK